MITSLEIAKVTGKLHKNVMRDIKAMEPAWGKLTGLKFELTSEQVKMPQDPLRPSQTLSPLPHSLGLWTLLQSAATKRKGESRRAKGEGED